MSAVYVCPERDIECGSRTANWCQSCPKRAAAQQIDAAGNAKPEASFLEREAVRLLNAVKAWRDCDGNDGFPDEVRLHIDALLMTAELRRTGLVEAAAHQGRDASAKALEFAEYMAKGAERTLVAINEMGRAVVFLDDEADPDDSEALAKATHDVQQAEDILSEQARSLREKIYEFRKRAAKVAAPAAPALDTPAPAEQNQCDGCLRNLPLIRGLHRVKGGWPIGCIAPAAKPVPLVEKTALSSFIRDASPEQKETVYSRVIEQATADQEAMLAASHVAPADQPELLRVLWEEIGVYSVQCAQTGELAPSSSLVAAIDAVSANFQAPAVREPLSVERIDEMIRRVFVAVHFPDDFRRFARAIESAHGIQVKP